MPFGNWAQRSYTSLKAWVCIFVNFCSKVLIADLGASFFFLSSRNLRLNSRLNYNSLMGLEFFSPWSGFSRLTYIQP